MSTALHLKLTGNDYFKSFPKALTYVQAAANNSDGFKLIYRILEIIHPRLRVSKGGVHKTVEAPSYSDVEDGSIYTFMTRYKNYLLYEQLSPMSRTYNKREQTMFVLQALLPDKRFRAGLVYVEATIQAYQRDSRAHTTIPFPIDLEIDEIAVTIDERSDNYTVGDNIRSPKISNPYARGKHARTLESVGKPVVRALGRRDRPSNDSNRRTGVRDNSRLQKNTQTCKACQNVGHCITNPETICFNMAKAHICSTYMADPNNKDIIKSNTYKYRKDRKEKSIIAKQTSKMDGILRKMEDDGRTEAEMAPLIHMANAMTVESDTEGYDSISESSEEE